MKDDVNVNRMEMWRFSDARGEITKWKLYVLIWTQSMKRAIYVFGSIQKRPTYYQKKCRNFNIFTVFSVVLLSQIYTFSDQIIQLMNRKRAILYVLIEFNVLMSYNDSNNWRYYVASSKKREWSRKMKWKWYFKVLARGLSDIPTDMQLQYPQIRIYRQ